MTEVLFVILAFILFCVIIWVIKSNIIAVRKFNINTEKQTSVKRVVYVADVFLNKYPLTVRRVISKIEKCNPDIIIITGNGLRDTEKIVEKLKNISKVYFAFTDMQSEDALDNNKMKIYNDYSVFALSHKINQQTRDDLEAFSKLENFKIVLCETPALFDMNILKNDVDLAFGYFGGKLMIRLAFFGIIYSTKGGFLPKYSNRFYKEKHCTMISTTGAGPAFLPVRINNFPEIICANIEN